MGSDGFHTALQSASIFVFSACVICPYLSCSFCKDDFVVIHKRVVAFAYGSSNFPSICAGGGEVEAENDGSVDVGLAVPHHFTGLVFLLYVGGFCVGQITGEHDMWP